MPPRALHPGLVVKVNKLGREFQARLTGEPVGGRYPVEPLERQITYRSVKRSEIRQVLYDPAQPKLGAA